MKNNHLKFSCKNAYLRVEHAESPFTNGYAAGQVIEIPIAHHDGSYFATPETLAELKANDQILFRYCDAGGMPCDEANPNGSVDHIAGICNKAGNVLGMMPHPERHADAIIGGTDGRALFASLLARAA